MKKWFSVSDTLQFQESQPDASSSVPCCSGLLFGQFNLQNALKSSDMRKPLIQRQHAGILDHCIVSPFKLANSPLLPSSP